MNALTNLPGVLGFDMTPDKGHKKRGEGMDVRPSGQLETQIYPTEGGFSLEKNGSGGDIPPLEKPADIVISDNPTEITIIPPSQTEIKTGSFSILA